MAESPLPLAVFDVDGVLADVRHRLHHLDTRPRDWPAFFAAATGDPPLPVGVHLVRTLAADHDILYLTGRPAWMAEQTTGWLRAHGLPPGRLLMRGRDDRRPARLVKPRLLREATAGRQVAVVVDDDPEACAALRAAGFPVHQADWMPPGGPLSEAQEEHGRT